MNKMNSIISAEHVALRVAIKDKVMAITGLKLQSMQLKNSFLEQNTINSGDWKTKLASSGKHHLHIILSGDYHLSNIHLSLQRIAFSNEELDCTLQMEGAQIKGKFLINEYEIYEKYNSFAQFSITLTNVAAISYIADIMLPIT